MGRSGAFVVIAILPIACVIACSTRSDGGPPPTVAEQCASSCAVPRGADHPCVGQQEDPTCQSKCVSALEGKSDQCRGCFLGSSGWRGTICECSSAFGIETTCKECSVRGGSRSCATNIIGKCTDGARSCEGWKSGPLDSSCSTACGIPVDATKTLCETACQAPRDAGHPCTNASLDKVEACIATCVTHLTGKSEACGLCYFKYSTWVGTTCKCSGESCEQCAWSGLSTTSSKGCTSVPAPPGCSVGNQCGGFRDQGIDVPQCAATCGVPPKEPDAGTDAADAADASADAPSDG